GTADIQQAVEPCGTPATTPSLTAASRHRERSEDLLAISHPDFYCVLICLRFVKDLFLKKHQSLDKLLSTI
ncbi:MAG: hypothetical protein MJZ94_06765, partial [Bacteroidales bacterium]|nr:hypothetical protein [Bacteroidales bacterium]